MKKIDLGKWSLFEIRLMHMAIEDAMQYNNIILNSEFPTHRKQAKTRLKTFPKLRDKIIRNAQKSIKSKSN